MTSLGRDVITASWELWYAKGSYRVQVEALELSRQALADAEERIRCGRLAKVDVLPFQTDIGSLLESMPQAESDVARRRVGLARLIGQPIGSAGSARNLELADVTVDRTLQKSEVAARRIAVAEAEQTLKRSRQSVLESAADAHEAWMAAAIRLDLAEKTVGFAEQVAAGQRQRCRVPGFGRIKFAVDGYDPRGVLDDKVHFAFATRLVNLAVTLFESHKGLALKGLSEVEATMRPDHTARSRIDRVVFARKACTLAVEVGEERCAEGEIG